MLKYFGSLIFALCLLPSLAFGQANTQLGLPAGTAIGSGYSIANGQLYMATSASLQAIALPFSYSIDFQGSFSATSGIGGNTDNSAFTAGLVFEYNSSLSNDYYHILTYIRPAYANTGCSSNGALCWRSPAIADGNRHNLCITWSGTSGHLYIDGVERDKTTSIGSGVTISNTLWTIAGGGVATNTIWDYRIYNFELAGEDCSNLSVLQQNNLIPSAGTLTQGLIVHLPFNNCTTSGALVSCADTSGNGNNSTNDKAPPVVVLTAPTTGSQSGSVSMTATCTDPGGLACTMVCFEVDGVLVNTSACATASPYTFSWNSATILDGSHTVTAIGYTVGGASASSSGVAITTTNSTSAKVYAFDASSGSDSNACTASLPCQTVTKMNALTYHGGDTLELHNTSTFTFGASLKLCGPQSGCTQNFFPSGAAFTIETYGSGTCNAFNYTGTTPPANCAEVIVANPNSFDAIYCINCANVTVQNLAILGNSATQNSAATGRARGSRVCQ